MKRLEHNATTLEEVRVYYTTRALQLAVDGFSWSHQLNEIEDWGVYTTFSKNEQIFESLYVYHDKRGEKKAKEFLLTSPFPVLTVPDCKIESFLQHIKKPYVMAALHTEQLAYKMIENYYRDQAAKRSGVFLMNHIDEGLVVLAQMLNTSHACKMAFCLHPLFQADEDLRKNSSLAGQIDSYQLMLAMEYRNIANDYLSYKKITNIDDIRLSPLQEVNSMLIADKIQNYKDFIIYHKGIHKRSAELDNYFLNWFKKLEIDLTAVEQLKKKL